MENFENKNLNPHSLDTTLNSVDNSLKELVHFADMENSSYIIVTDYNTFDNVTDYFNQWNFSTNSVYNINGNTKIIAGSLVNCFVQIENEYKFISLLVYAPKNLNKSQIGKLLNIKKQHDQMSNYDILNYLSAKHNIAVTSEQIDAYLETKKKSGKFNKYLEKQDIVHILKRYGMVRNNIKLEKLLADYEGLAYLNLDAKDVIQLAHISHAFCLIVNPSRSLNNKFLQENGAKLLASYNIDGQQLDYNVLDRQSEKFFYDNLAKYSTKKLTYSRGLCHSTTIKNKVLGTIYYL